jgi:hypothetical protein
MTAAPRRGVRKEKSLDLDDLIGGHGPNKSTPNGMYDNDDSDKKSLSQFQDDLGPGDMSDSASVSSVSSTRSHSRRGSRSRAVVDRTRKRSKDNFSTLNKSVESGLFSYMDKEGGSDEEDEKLLFGDAAKNEGPAIAAIKKDVAMDRKKLRERMRRERSGEDSPKPEKEKISKKGSKKERPADTEEQIAERERLAEKEERRAKRRLRKEKEETEETEEVEPVEKEKKSSKRRSNEKEKKKKEESEPTEPPKRPEAVVPVAAPYRSKTQKKFEKEQALLAEEKKKRPEIVVPVAAPYRSKTEKKFDKEQALLAEEKKKRPEMVVPVAAPYRSKTEKKKEKETEQAIPEKRPEMVVPIAMPYRSKTQKKLDKEKEKEQAIPEKRPEMVVPTAMPYRSKTQKKLDKEKELAMAAPDSPKTEKKKLKEKKRAKKDADSSAMDETRRHENLSPVKVKRDLPPVTKQSRSELSATLSPSVSAVKTVKRTRSPKVDEEKSEKPLQKHLLRRPSLKGDQSPRSLTEAENGWAEEASRASTQQSGTTDDSDDNVSDDGTVLQFDPSQADSVYRVAQIKREDSVYNIKNKDGTVVTGHISKINDSLSSESEDEDSSLESSSSEEEEEEEEDDDDASNTLSPLSGEESSDDEDDSPVEEVSPPSGDETDVPAPSGGEEEIDHKPSRARKVPGRSKSSDGGELPSRWKAPDRSQSYAIPVSSDHSKKKKKKVRKQAVVPLDGPSDSEGDSPQKPRRRLKKKEIDIDPPSIGDEEENPSEPAPLSRKATMKASRQEPTSPGSLAASQITANYNKPPKATDAGDEGEKTDSEKPNKRMSVGMKMGRFFGRRNSTATDADESDDGGSISGSVHGGVFGRGAKKKHLLLGDSDSSFDSGGGMPF